MKELSILSGNVTNYLHSPGDTASITVAKNGALISKLHTKDFKYSKLTYKTGSEVHHFSRKKSH